MFVSVGSAQVQPFIGQTVTVAFNFCPKGWTEMDGKLLPIAGFETCST
jgi:microcystin-dependent protein